MLNGLVKNARFHTGIGKKAVIANLVTRQYSRYALNSQCSCHKEILSKNFDESHAAEANPIKTLYQEEILREICEAQRIQRFMLENEPRKMLNIRGIYPQMVMTEKPGVRKTAFTFTSKFDSSKSDEYLISEEEALRIISEMQKPTQAK
ncbi:unnamed protein product [Moneuplotes crassus]|uniref:Uncharacterized protein n=1 Tax=Euplotes crassus TaxID=5936 RepID=A0AAD2D6H4_EUPCR|nr:unnamed protein product [Moneuplotes crassus]